MFPDAYEDSSLKKHGHAPWWAITSFSILLRHSIKSFSILWPDFCWLKLGFSSFAFNKRAMQKIWTERYFLPICPLASFLNVSIFVGTFFLLFLFLLFLFTNKWCRKFELKGIHPLTSFLLGSRQTFHLEHSMEMMGRAEKLSFFWSDGIECFFSSWDVLGINVFFNGFACVEPSPLNVFWRYSLSLCEIFVNFVWDICYLWVICVPYPSAGL